MQSTRWLSNVYAILLFCITIMVVHPALYADGEFQTEYVVDYELSTTGVARVTQHIRLINQISRLYAQEFSLTVAANDIRHVSVSDQNGSITPMVRSRGETTEIVVPFDEPAIGVGNATSFTISYETNSIATKNGRIWEIHIPGMKQTDDIAKYTVSYRVPKSFGDPLYQRPAPDVQGTWNLDTMKHGGITSAYGDQQYFQLHLNYFLENTQPFGTTKTITLPPETAFQTVSIDAINPPPDEVTIDHDGNWLAHYPLAGNSSLDIAVDLTIETHLQPNRSFAQKLTDAQLSQYTQAQPFWESDYAAIKQEALRLQTPRAMYQYVVEQLSYDYTQLSDTFERQGALNVFEKKDHALCMEFTDLFIALARSAGIPARMVQGYAYTTNAHLRPLSLVRDVLHAWPEYYDAEQKLWIPVDPTWGNTTGGIDYFSQLDFNHVAFAILGIDSTKPFPAGSFRKKDRDKDITITFLDSVPEIPDPQATVSFDFSVTNSAVHIVNTGSVAYDVASLSVTTDPSSTKLTIPQTPFLIPPYGEVAIPITLPLTMRYNKNARMQVTMNGTTYEHRIGDTTAQSFGQWTVRFWIAGFVLFILMAFRIKQQIHHHA